ncbi:MAG: response regulator [Anaerolineales bacterium]
MKIAEFSILIVDDNREVAGAIADEVRIWLEERGFELKISVQSKKDKVLEAIKSNDIELIIIDYGLDDDENGDAVIEEIRKNDYFHDIIFYTGGDMENILKKRLNGVFYTSKKDAINIIEEVIELRLKRSSDLATLRGWIVADAIELEHMIEELLLKWFNPKHSVFEAQIMRKPGVFDFYKKQMTLNGILTEELRVIAETKDKSERAKKIQECKEVFKSFENDVVHYRNAVAHSKVDIKDGKKRLKSLIGKDNFFEFDEKNLIDARKKFRMQRDCLQTLFDVL